MSSIAANGVTARRVAENPGSGLAQRVVSAVVLAPIALVFVWVGGTAFAALVAVAGVLMAAEWERLTGGTGRDGVGLAQLFGVLASVGLTAFVGPGAGIAAVAVGVGVALVLGRARGYWPALGAGYIGLPLVSLVALRDLPEDGLAAVAWLLIVVWSMDIFAYVAGRAIGGPKLAPSISPKKTWAGLIGGAVASTVAGALAAPEIGADPWSLAMVSGALGAFSQLGDLFESQVKRRFGVKDSGNLIPGHGGILDRVDGLVFAAMALGVMTILFGSPFGVL